MKLRSCCPVAAIACTLLAENVSAQPQAAKTITFGMMEKIVLKKGTVPQYPSLLSSLAGRKVRITGYVSPYDVHTLQLRKFVLTPEAADGCYSCNPSDEKSVIMVRMPAGGKPMTWNSDTVTVEGVLRLKTTAWNQPELGEILVTVDGATVVARK